ncbi:uncharacterized protein [Neodiprion pinetum]|uniref:Uncharacterized protein LOC107226345 n=1 Tax=Neodiprion lecontei TaxID=441921 RepID=A0A6J0C890_NEOLC|nr:uncharacterized protein LOC107226345 [Neodiprion lecontei]XP_046493171.1 uncharacterized protein LOC124224935 [Neodiprion pinetum]
MAGRSKRTRKNATQQDVAQDASTQTSPDKTSVQVIELQEEVQLLKQTVDRLMKTQLPNGRRHDNFPVLDKEQGHSLAAVVPSSQLNPETKEQQIGATIASPQINKILGKGCSCKGKCISKICGCVKKDIPCGEFCKCTHAKCQNKESNKENIPNPNVQDTLTGVADHVFNNLSVLTLKDHQTRVMNGTVGASNKTYKNIEKATKSIFSPDTPSAYKDEVPLDSLKLNTTFYLADAKKNLSYTSDSSVSPLGDRSHSNTTRTNNAGKKTKKNSGKSQTREDSDDDVELLIDPMKPTRQLPRTPITGSPQSFRLELSAAPISSPKDEVEEKPILPPEDFNAPVVNLEEHYAQLLPCKLCHRKFYPYRLQKHEASCKKL